MRRRIKAKPEIEGDIKYNSPKLAKFINTIMQSGKKETARRVVYGAMTVIVEKTGNANPLEVFDLAIKNAGPSVEVRSRRIGGANYQVPREVRPERKNALAVRWLVAAARAQKGKPMAYKLAEELILASKNEGSAVKKRDDTHRMADANKAFAHFAW